MVRKFMVVSSAGLMALAATPAYAAEPTREVNPGQDDVVITDQCNFPVLAHVDGREIITTYVDTTGAPVKQTQIFPGNRLILTNMESGTSVTRMGTGATIVRAASDGGVSVQITGHGPFSPNPLTAEPGIWYLSGRGKATFDADANLTSVVITGQLDDLCAQLTL